MSTEPEATRANERVVVYATAWCPHCKRAKELLFTRGIAFTEVDAEERWGSAFRDQVQALTGRSTVPQVVIDGKAIGGFSELVELDESGGLRGLVASKG